MSKEEKNIIEEIQTDPEFRQRLKELVIERINVMPDTLKMAVGSENLDKDELVESVREENEVGRQVMEMELKFLRDLASGAIYVNE